MGMTKSTPARDRERFWAKVGIAGADQCWNWMGCANERGYGRVRFNNINQYAHRVAAQIHFGEIGDRMVCHKCDHRICCNPKHLFLGTAKDNMQDCIVKGRHRFGFGNKLPQAKLTPEIVSQIRARYERRVVTLKKLALEYGVSDDTIAGVIHGRTWAWVPPENPAIETHLKHQPDQDADRFYGPALTNG